MKYDFSTVCQSFWNSVIKPEVKHTCEWSEVFKKHTEVAETDIHYCWIRSIDFMNFQVSRHVEGWKGVVVPEPVWILSPFHSRSTPDQPFSTSSIRSHFVNPRLVIPNIVMRKQLAQRQWGTIMIINISRINYLLKTAFSHPHNERCCCCGRLFRPIWPK